MQKICLSPEFWILTTEYLGTSCRIKNASFYYIWKAEKRKFLWNLIMENSLLSIANSTKFTAYLVHIFKNCLKSKKLK